MKKKILILLLIFTQLISLSAQIWKNKKDSIRFAKTIKNSEYVFEGIIPTICDDGGGYYNYIVIITKVFKGKIKIGTIVKIRYPLRNGEFIDGCGTPADSVGIFFCKKKSDYETNKNLSKDHLSSDTLRLFAYNERADEKENIIVLVSRVYRVYGNRNNYAAEVYNFLRSFHGLNVPPYEEPIKKQLPYIPCEGCIKLQLESKAQADSEMNIIRKRNKYKSDSIKHTHEMQDNDQ
jgi:hypothetical protein